MASRKREVEDLGDIELDEKVDAKVRQMTAQADAELEETRVNFRWGKQQLGVVKRVADLMGVPYQTYIKEAIYRQALEDLSNLALLNARENVPLSGVLCNSFGVSLSHSQPLLGRISYPATGIFGAHAPSAFSFSGDKLLAD